MESSRTEEGKRLASIGLPRVFDLREAGMLEHMRVLVVEDDVSISAPLREGLTREGFDVEVVSTGAAALSADPADLVLLDLGLPDLEGAVVCKRMRSASKVPIIVVSARGEEIDRVMLLELGADDYLVKPFGFRELVARIHAVMRRSTTGASETVSALETGPLRIDIRTHDVRFADKRIDLTPREYELLVYLAADPGAVRSRGEIMRDVWDEHWWGSTKTLDVHIASLRKKLAPELIETVRSVGYRIVDVTQSGS